MPNGVQFNPAWPEMRFKPEGDERNPWETLCVHRVWNGLWHMEVPAGFRCDLASIPGWCLWLFGPNGKHQRAALFHDGAYRFHPCSRRMADTIFFDLMEHDGVPYAKAWIAWAAVRCFGRRAYDKHTSPESSP